MSETETAGSPASTRQEVEMWLVPLIEAGMTEAEVRRIVEAGAPPRLGCRLFASPFSLLGGYPYLIVGTNPGGDEAEPERDGFDCPNGNAYKIERWKRRKKVYPPGMAPLQRQVQRMCAVLKIDLDRTPCGQWYPYRTAGGWSSLLPDQKRAYSVSARPLWRWILVRAGELRAVLCFGKDAGEGIAGLLLGTTSAERLTLPSKKPDPRRRTIVDVYRTGSGPVVLALPHLSWAGVFSPKAAKPTEREMVVLRAFPGEKVASGRAGAEGVR